MHAARLRIADHEDFADGSTRQCLRRNGRDLFSGLKRLCCTHNINKLIVRIFDVFRRRRCVRQQIDANAVSYKATKQVSRFFAHTKLTYYIRHSVYKANCYQ